jgi:predicted NACHT family NTPase
MSADGRYALSGSSDGTLRLWDILNGVCLHTYKGHAGGITSVCLTADGRFGLSGSWDKTLRLWDLGNGNCLRTFEGHTDMVRSISMSADGRFALSAGGEKNLHLWFLDWELEEKEPASWDEEARPYLENFLNQHSLGANIFGKWKGSEWTEEDFQQLLYTLGYAGYGWLREEGVRRKLEELSR